MGDHSPQRWASRIGILCGLTGSVWLFGCAHSPWEAREEEPLPPSTEISAQDYLPATGGGPPILFTLSRRDPQRGDEASLPSVDDPLGPVQEEKTPSEAPGNATIAAIAEPTEEPSPLTPVRTQEVEVTVVRSEAREMGTPDYVFAAPAEPPPPVLPDPAEFLFLFEREADGSSDTDVGFVVPGVIQRTPQPTPPPPEEGSDESE